MLMQHGYNGIDSLFEVASAQGNIGLTTGIISATMPPIAQVFLLVNIWIGRIEIIPALVLVKLFIDLVKRI